MYVHHIPGDKFTEFSARRKKYSINEGHGHDHDHDVHYVYRQAYIDILIIANLRRSLMKTRMETKMFLNFEREFQPISFLLKFIF